MKRKNRKNSRLHFMDKYNLLKCKRSQAHVEMMISFVIFVGALIFIFIFINPLKGNKQDNSIEEIQKIILKNISLDIAEISVVINSTNDCYDIPSYGDKFVEVKDSDRKYTLYFNLSASPATQSCVAKLPRNYSFGVYSEENFIIYENTVELADNYNSNYNNLKDSLGITKDFSFSFREIEGNIINEISVSRNIPNGIDVNAKEFPVRIINSSAGIRNLILNIKVW